MLYICDVLGCYILVLYNKGLVPHFVIFYFILFYLPFLIPACLLLIDSRQHTCFFVQHHTWDVGVVNEILAGYFFPQTHLGLLSITRFVLVSVSVLKCYFVRL